MGDGGETERRRSRGGWEEEQESNEVGRQVERRKGVGGGGGGGRVGVQVGRGGRCCEGRITYSAGVFGTQLIKPGRGEMQKG